MTLRFVCGASAALSLSGALVQSAAISSTSAGTRDLGPAAGNSVGLAEAAPSGGSEVDGRPSEPRAATMAWTTAAMFYALAQGQGKAWRDGHEQARPLIAAIGEQALRSIPATGTEPIYWDEGDIRAGDVAAAQFLQLQLAPAVSTEAVTLERVSLFTDDALLSIDGGLEAAGDRHEQLRCYRGATGDGLVLAVATAQSVTGVLFPGVKPGLAPRVSSDEGGAFDTGGLGGPPDGPGASFPVVRLALDADTEFHERFGAGDVHRTMQQMMLAVNALDFLFQREVGVRYRVSYLSVWTQEPDPYYSLSTKDLVNGMRAWWNTNRWWVARDSAHLLSGKFMDKLGATPQVDEGYPGYMCDISMAYSVSSTGSQGDPLFNLYSNVMHEQGHQWGSGHCSGTSCRLMCGDPGCFVPIYEFEPFTRSIIWDQLGRSVCLGRDPAGSTGANLIVTGVDLPDRIGIGHSHRVGVRIRNVGAARASTTVKVWTWLTLDGNPFAGMDDIPMGGPGLNARWPGVAIDLGPGESQTLWFDTFQVPVGALEREQTFVAWADAGALPCASLCESNENDNLGSVPVRVISDDAAILWVDAPSGALPGQSVPVQFRVVNNSAGRRHLPVNACIGPNCAPTIWFNDVGPGEERSGVAYVTAPNTFFDCGNPEAFPVSVCVNLFYDSNPSNNCRSDSIAITEYWWDLRFEILDEPDSVSKNRWFSYKVRVRNVGNSLSDDVCAIAGVTRYSGARNWNSNLGIQQFRTGRIAPGGSRTFAFSYFVPGNAACNVRQYLKAEVHYSAGCSDYCGVGNFDQESIYIRCN